MSSIETELWNIYTYYTLHGNPRDPAHIQVLCFLAVLGFWSRAHTACGQ